MTSVQYRSKSAGPPNTAGGGFFLTQKGEKHNEVKREIAELEALLAGATQTSQSTLLLKKRKEMREVDEALELMKEEYKSRMDACEEHRLQFETKQAKMREQVLKFEKFIQENDAKRQRAEAKAKQERKLFEQKCQELTQLAEKIDELERSQRQLDEQLRKNACYREYLESYIDAGEISYEEVSDVLNRYKTLRDANVNLMKHVESLENEVDSSRNKLQILKLETQNKLLVSNSKFQQKQHKLQEVQTKMKLEEKEKELHEDKSKNVTREASQVVQSIKNIFTRCQSSIRNKSHIAVPNKDFNLHELLFFNLDVIHARISDLMEISSEYRHSVESIDNHDLKDSSGFVTQFTAGSGNGAGSQVQKQIVRQTTSTYS